MKKEIKILLIILAYGVASVSGTILAVCSCTVLPLFASIYKMGAGIGPATFPVYYCRIIPSWAWGNAL